MIRPGTLADLDELHLLARLVVNNLRANGIDQWSNNYPLREHFAPDVAAGALFVYCIADQLVGSITVMPENEMFYHEVKWDTASAYVVHRLMVHPEHLRQGIGTSLFEHAIGFARTCGASGVKVDTHPDNHRMQALIKSLGFTEKGYIRSINRIGYEIVF